MTTDAAAQLNGLRVLVTRPAHQAEGLCAAIEAAGGHPLRQPLLEIGAPVDAAAAYRGLCWAADADDAIFTSSNAVDWAWRLVPALRLAGRAAAVGRATARALARKTVVPVLTPESDYSSAGLLALPEYADPAGRRVAVVTGEGGRRQLPDTLAERGADVRTVAVYRRLPVPVPRRRLEALLAEADAIVITSGQSLQHLFDITPPARRRLLLTRQLVVPSSRVLKLALELGFTREPARPSRMDDEAVTAALQRLAAGPHTRGG